MRAAIERERKLSSVHLGHDKSASVCHIIMGEAAHAGGMTAHMTLLADGLAKASEEVHVWLPDVNQMNLRSSAVMLHTTLGELSVRDFLRTGKLLNGFPAPRRLLVYWVPHAYGHKSMNVLFCIWLWFRSAWRKDRIELLVQECFLDFSKRSWRQSGAALVHRIMTIIILRAAHRIWGALSTYQELLRPYMLGRRVPFEWLPVPSNVEVVEDRPAVEAIRKRFAKGGFLIGHFGTFGGNITELLERIVPDVLRTPNSSLLLLGSGSEAFRDRLQRLCPNFAEHIHATGFLDDSILSSHLSACDVMIQPYPDGLTARRGSMLAPLAHGRPVVTNPSNRTESIWTENAAVVLAPITGSGFLEAVLWLKEDAREWNRVSASARETYLRYFEPGRMVKAISIEGNTCVS